MYCVDVYEEDRVTFAGTREFTNKEACKQFALLNQPCIVFYIIHSCTDGVSCQEIARYGMEDEK